MTAEIIAIGTEILLGNIVNTNASFLAETLAALGINTYHQQVVGDNPERLREALKNAFETADLVITSGGLGPTEDDLSKETGAQFMGAKLVMDETARAHIEGYFTKKHLIPTPNNWKQAELPEGCTPFYNHNGTAPGFALEKDGRTLIMLPGPPSEIVPMVKECMIPYLRSRSDAVLVSRTLHTAGKGESALEAQFHDQMVSMTNPTLAPYAKEGMVDLRITARAKTEEEALSLIAPVEKDLCDLMGQDVLGIDEDTIESVVVDLLKQRHWTVATAESCTGGWVCGRLVNVSGASDVVNGGLVTYTNEMKQQLLGVKKETLDAYTAVSEQTAGEMAEGAARVFGTDTAVSVTGLAGPGEGMTDSFGKLIPVGTICFGVYVKGKIDTFTVTYRRNRNSNREISTFKALDLLRRCILNDNL